MYLLDHEQITQVSGGWEDTRVDMGLLPVSYSIGAGDTLPPWYLDVSASEINRINSEGGVYYTESEGIVVVGSAAQMALGHFVRDNWAEIVMAADAMDNRSTWYTQLLAAILGNLTAEDAAAAAIEASRSMVITGPMPITLIM